MLRAVFPSCRHPRRRHALPWPTVIIGLTGSIAMGKSTAAQMMKRMGLAVFDADAEVHQLIGPRGAALPALRKRFPDVVGPNGVDRQMLGQAVFGNEQALTDLEAILHPMVGQRRRVFLRTQALRRARCVVLDIPLLLEAKSPPACDEILVVSAPRFLQRQRVLQRPSMTEEKFSAILARQMPDQKKRRLADAVVYSGLGKRETLYLLKRALTCFVGTIK